MAHAFGRNVEHDPRSRNFAHSEKALVKRTTLWAHHAPVLDQGQIGSCTGNALAQCLNADYFTGSRPNRYLDEHDAILLYSKATHLDRYTGYYPPDDTGSSGLAVAKAGKAFGYLSAYRWTFSFTALLSALQTQPLIVGTAFYAGMEDPNAAGLVEPTGQVLGGHEYACIGCDYASETLTFLNSWSSDWGVNGRFRMRFADFAALQADQGDVTVPIGKQ